VIAAPRPGAGYITGLDSAVEALARLAAGPPVILKLSDHRASNAGFPAFLVQ